MISSCFFTKVKIEDLEALIQPQLENRGARGILDAAADYDYNVYHSYDDVSFVFIMYR